MARTRHQISHKVSPGDQFDVCFFRVMECLNIVHIVYFYQNESTLLIICDHVLMSDRVIQRRRRGICGKELYYRDAV